MSGIFWKIKKTSTINTGRERVYCILYETIVGHDILVRFCFFIDGLDEFSEETRSQTYLIPTLRISNIPPT
jgi:hypothetical protein